MLWALAWLMSGHSVVVLSDVMAEFALVCAPAAKRLGIPVKLVNPFGMWQSHLKEYEHVGYNPSGPRALDPDSPMFEIGCSMIANSVIDRTHERESFWNDGTDQAITGVLQCEAIRGERPDLPRVSEIIHDNLYKYSRWACSNPYSWSIKNNLQTWADKDAEAVKSNNEIISTARKQLKFVNLRPIAESLSKDDFAYAETTHKAMLICVLLPYTAIVQSPDTVKFLRLHLNSIIRELSDGERTGDIVPLIIAEEYYQIAQSGLPQVPLSLAAGRKFRYHLVLSCTGLSDLRSVHKQDYEGMFNNCGFVSVLEANDPGSSEILSKWCGKREVIIPSKSLNNDIEKGKWSVNESLTVRDKELIQPHEIRGLQNEAIVFMDGVRGRGPLRLNKVSYRDFPELVAIAGPNPYYEKRKSLNGTKTGRS
jgi:type IV secretory pathway TraG/TraD family ATPase VirD4